MGDLSRVVVRIEGGITSWSKIDFDDSFETHCAKVMPRGLGRLDQAYIKVIHNDFMDRYEIWCCYANDDTTCRQLWVTKESPIWL